MIIDVYTFCWNEEVRLPYFLRQWAPVARRIIIYDNGSTDKSREIALRHKNVVWDTVTYKNSNQINEHRLTYTKNNCWKQSRDADLCFVGDIDEFMYHPMGLPNFLYETYNSGFTLYKANGFEMATSSPPKHDGLIWECEDFKYGWQKPKDYNLNKTTIFSPRHIGEMKFDHGAQDPEPIGRIKWFNHENFKLLHYKLIGKDYYLNKLRGASKRLSVVNRQMGWGVHYLESREVQSKYFDEVYKNREKVVDI